MGINRLATLSNGEFVTDKKPYRHLVNRIRRLSRSISRKQNGSANWQEAIMRLAKLHDRVANIRRDELHQLTATLTNNLGVIVIEDLSVAGMMKNRRLARAIGDQGFGEFRRQLAYKSELRANKLIVADKWYASSKVCSKSDTKRDSLPMKIRIWTCEACGERHDRDLNAAKQESNTETTYE